ncbi:MAG: exopolysaccharide Pel transporter PelG [Clostridium perfringens]|nr:exopolysaccharide Pel transporter PelG [Clostridium perfringens]MDU7955195.1 exopolysaccharide Pel transporter PelG [Clostridium perfringens]MDU7963159.1 exopolysaccharide Pel transporter PelG [Clostridium perfringens]
MSFLILILLYFDARKDALQVSLVFFITTVLLSIITVIIGPEYYGYGFFISSIISVVFAFNRINNFFKTIEYKTFLSQPVFQIEEKGVFRRIYNYFNKDNKKEV